MGISKAVSTLSWEVRVFVSVASCARIGRWWPSLFGNFAHLLDALEAWTRKNNERWQHCVTNDSNYVENWVESRWHLLVSKISSSIRFPRVEEGDIEVETQGVCNISFHRYRIKLSTIPHLSISYDYQELHKISHYYKYNLTFAEALSAALFLLLQWTSIYSSNQGGY